MSLRVVRVSAATTDEWDRTWSSCDYATYFHSRAWAEIWSVSTRGRMRPAPRFLRFSDGTHALLPLSRERLLGGFSHRTWSSPAGTYGGWLAGPGLSAEHASLLVEWLKAHEANLSWRQNPYAPGHQRDTMPWRHDRTLTLDLGPAFEDILRQWSRGHRSSIGKAIRSGITVRRARDDADWRNYYAVYLDSERRWGANASSHYGPGFFDVLRQRAETDSRIELWLAMSEDRVVAGALCLYSPRIAVYWHGAALQTHFESRPVNLLLHEAIRDAKSRGLAWFDFNPSGGHEGVEAFKQRFGTCWKAADFLATESPAIHMLRALARTWKKPAVEHGAGR